MSFAPAGGYASQVAMMPLPDGWIEEWDPASGRAYFVDTLKPNPLAVWDDPRVTMLQQSQQPHRDATASGQTQPYEGSHRMRSSAALDGRPAQLAHQQQGWQQQPSAYSAASPHSASTAAHQVYSASPYPSSDPHQPAYVLSPSPYPLAPVSHQQPNIHSSAPYPSFAQPTYSQADTSPYPSSQHALYPYPSASAPPQHVLYSSAPSASAYPDQAVGTPQDGRSAYPSIFVQTQQQQRQAEPVGQYYSAAPYPPGATSAGHTAGPLPGGQQGGGGDYGAGW